MDPTVLDLVEIYGISLPDVALTSNRWENLADMLGQLPPPGVLYETSPRNMKDPKTGQRIWGIQYERGVDGWGVYVSEHDDQVSLIRPESWYLAQFRDSQYDFRLPHFLEYAGGRSAVQYNWEHEQTFLKPPLQSRLTSIDTLNLSGTWVKTRYKADSDGFYVPSRVAVDLDLYSSNMRAEQARDSITKQCRMVFTYTQEGIKYNWARGQHEAGRKLDVNEGHTRVVMGSSRDIHRIPQQIDMYTEAVVDGVYFRISHAAFWQTEFHIPFSIEVPELKENTHAMDTETLDYWVDQHRSMV